MFANLESVLHRLRRRFSRSEWAIRHLGFTASDDTGEEPGLLLVQIDGFGRHQMEKAIEEGRMPFLRRLRERNDHALHTFYPGLPSTTPAVQAELFYGARAAVPAFRFKDRKRNRIVSLFDPAEARRIETDLAARERGLLDGGSSWSNIYCGGASPMESHFCVASIGFSDKWRAGRLLKLFLFALMQLPAVIRISGLVALEFFIGLGDALAGVLLRRQRVFLEMGMLLSRMCVGIGLREVVTVGAKVDLARGLPIVHVNFLGYDEAAHRRGPGSHFAHWTLKGIDRAVRELYSAAHRSRRRDYHVWIFSDHGQERTRSFADTFDGGIEAVIARCLKIAPPPVAPQAGHFSRRPLSRRAAESRAALQSETPSQEPFEVTAMGPVGHLYLRDPIDTRALAQTLVGEGKVPGILRCAPDGTIVWHHAEGESPVTEAAGRLRTHPAALRKEIVNDLAALFRHPDSGDLVLLGWDPAGDPWTFPAERGAHAGAGPEETQGFLLVPPATHLTGANPGFIRPSELRDAALTVTGRIPSKRPATRSRHGTRFRLMTYNVHSCIGTDGRVSPRRIARLIAQQAPDIVAIQEVEHGRARSRMEDQTAIIAGALDCHLAFCPAVTIGNERYGHAILSRYPLETVKFDFLPAPARSLWPEMRVALWTRISLDGVPVNLVTTHLGLSAAERLRQIEALLGDSWIGNLREPLIFCGDLNLAPGGPAHRLLKTRLRDATSAHGSRFRTFTSAHPFVQLDHIFHTAHFSVDRIGTIRNDLSRVASDHLPIMADMRLNRPA